MKRPHIPLGFDDQSSPDEEHIKTPKKKQKTESQLTTIHQQPIINSLPTNLESESIISAQTSSIQEGNAFLLAFVSQPQEDAALEEFEDDHAFEREIHEQYYYDEEMPSSDEELDCDEADDESDEDSDDESIQSNNVEVTPSPAISELEKPEPEAGRTQFCSARCSAGCKKCKCAKEKLHCCTKCKCKNCKNLPNFKEITPIQGWNDEKPQEFVQGVPEFSAGKTKTENPDFENAFSFFIWLLKKTGIMDNIVLETNEYKTFHEEVIEKLTTQEKKNRKEAFDNQKKKKKRQRSKKKAANQEDSPEEEVLNDDVDLETFQSFRKKK